MGGYHYVCIKVFVDSQKKKSSLEFQRTFFSLLTERSSMMKMSQKEHERKKIRISHMFT